MLPQTHFVLKNQNPEPKPKKKLFEKITHNVFFHKVKLKTYTKGLPKEILYAANFQKLQKKDFYNLFKSWILGIKDFV